MSTLICKIKLSFRVIAIFTHHEGCIVTVEQVRMLDFQKGGSQDAT